MKSVSVAVSSSNWRGLWVIEGWNVPLWLLMMGEQWVEKAGGLEAVLSKLLLVSQLTKIELPPPPFSQRLERRRGGNYTPERVSTRTVCSSQSLQIRKLRRVQIVEAARRAQRIRLGRTRRIVPQTARAIVLRRGRAPRPLRLVRPLLQARPLLPRPAAPRHLAHGVGEAAAADAALAVPGEGVLAGEAAAAGAAVRLVARVDFGVPLQVVLPHEALAAMVAAELPVAQVRLHVAADVLAPAERLAAGWEEARPPVAERVLRADVRGDFFGGDARVFDRCVQVQVGQRHRPGRDGRVGWCEERIEVGILGCGEKRRSVGEGEQGYGRHLFYVFQEGLYMLLLRRYRR